jgi:hypothetical protein
MLSEAKHLLFSAESNQTKQILRFAQDDRSLRGEIQERIFMNSQALLVLVLVVEGVILISLCTLFYQLLRQQGRILLRLDNLEQSATSGLAARAERPSDKSSNWG